jgi:replicative DNA helicase
MSNFESFLEAEQAVVGGLLLDNSKIADIDLTPLDFCDQAMGQIFGAMMQLESAGQPFDLWTVSEELSRTTGKDWSVTVATIARNTASATNVQIYAKSVRRYRKSRDVRRIALELSDNIALDESAIDIAISELMALDETAAKTTYTLKEALKKAVDKLDRVHKSGGKITGITSGLTDLDDCLGGFQESDLCVIGARPAMGKTGLLLGLALNCGVPAGVISAEMSAEQLATRAISNYGRVDSQRVRTANLEDDDWQKLYNGIGRMNDKPILIDEKSSPTIAEVQRWARKMKQKHCIKILFVDYLQRLSGNNPRDSRIEQVSEIARGLKTLARELNIPVVTLAQVNREVEKRTDKRPLMGDLANSSEIEKEADEIIMLYRDEAYNEDSQDAGVAELNVEKNRHGPTGLIRVAWLAKFIKFENLVQSWPYR